MSVTTRRIMPDTDRETPIFELESGTDGPTAMVVGGVHGDEGSGYRAAEAIAEWELDRGSLVVVPWANVVAVDAHERRGPDGDLNRQFPPDGEPTTDLARALWDAVTTADPDVVFDLHRSRGILGTHAKWVGQAVFPTPPGLPAARAVVDDVNDEVVPASMRFHRFVVSGPLTGTAPLLVHKVAAELGRPGYIVETTGVLVGLQRQVDWTLEIVERLLASHGVLRVGA
jgi:predicted deacylase